LSFESFIHLSKDEVIKQLTHQLDDSEVAYRVSDDNNDFTENSMVIFKLNDETKSVFIMSESENSNSCYVRILSEKKDFFFRQEYPSFYEIYSELFDIMEQSDLIDEQYAGPVHTMNLRLPLDSGPNQFSRTVHQLRSRGWNIYENLFFDQKFCILVKGDAVMRIFYIDENPISMQAPALRLFLTTGSSSLHESLAAVKQIPGMES
jgi:hypothetical protein